ncbi:MAG: TatD family hydrolase [Candidatus Pacebacteria bacterium]|nr:TatD family hydrolase [Candidatus Paceibacterota bacterium]
MKYIDIHSHINIDPLLGNKDEVIKRMLEQEVGTIIIGTDFNLSQIALGLAKEYDFIYAGVGLHPNDNLSEEFNYEKYLALAKNEKVVCIGETGLDYFRNEGEENKIRQKEIFKRHIELAIEVNKPLMIHARPSKGSMPVRPNEVGHSGGDAYIDALDILEIYKKDNPMLHANFHFFVGDLEIAKRILKNNWTVSFDGPITFARDYDEVIKFLPIENIMCETDAPFAAPVPHRGKTCEPYMVIEIYKKIAEIKGLDLETTTSKIRENVKRVFRF